MTWGTSAPSIVTRGTSAPSIVTWGTSAPSIEASGYSMLRVKARYALTFNAGPNVAVHFEGAVTVNGGHSVEVKQTTPQEWCDYYGVPVVDGVIILFKAVGKDYRSSRGGDYTPGTVPSVETFRPEPECAAGALYFSPTTRHTHTFVSNPDRYVACPVNLADIVTHPNGDYPAKVKAKGCCAPVYEVDVHGDRIEVPA